jgi:TIR domain-containing protein
VGYVFVSYSRADKEYVDRLIDYLRRFELTLWVDDKLTRGVNWQRELKGRIEGCSALLIVESPAAEHSDYVQNEVRLAQTLRRPVFPLLRLGEWWWSISSQGEDVRSGGMPSLQFIDHLRAVTNAPPMQGPPPAPPPPVVVRPQPRRRPARTAIGVSIVLALLVGLGWGGVQAWGAISGWLGNVDDEPELLKATVIKSAGHARVSVTSVKATSGSTVVSVKILNAGEGSFAVWSCCTLVEQPGGKQRNRSGVNGGDLPDTPQSPIAAGTSITGTVRFGGGLHADTTSLVFGLQYQEANTMPTQLSLGGIALNR